MVRRTIMLMIGMALALVAGAASAGGWAVVTLDTLPGEVRAGETLELGFVVRQHGQTPVDVHTWEGGRMPVLWARHSETGEELMIGARKAGVEGHYAVSVTFPRAGIWAWQITPEPFAPTRFEPLVVLAPAPAQATNLAGVISFGRPALLAVGVALLVVAALLALGSRRNARDRSPAGVVR
jgi:hypothetical protein